ncbi:MAG: hypothetical protein AAF721_02675, partial [Myxococcota bacterium]
GIGVVLRRVRLDVAGVYQFRTPATGELPPGATARVGHGYAEVRACPILGGPRVVFLGCGGLDIGAFEARASGLAQATTGRDLWLGLSATAGVQWRFIPRLAISLEPAAVFSLLRPRFAVDGLGEVFRTGVVGGRVVLALEAQLF